MKIAIVTGASSGMGRECAIQMGDRFSKIEEIWLIARRKKRLEELKGKIPVKIRCFGIDITLGEQRQELKEALEREKPDVKLLVNAAGAGTMGRIGQVDLETECAMVRLNCEALCAVTNLVLPYMSKNSRIVQFASAAAFLPQPGFGIYAGTKAFVLSYARALGAELKERQISVLAVCPGAVDTEFFGTNRGGENLPFYKKMVMAKPRKVVAKALRDSMMGKGVSVYGLAMNGFWVLTKVLPHEVILKMMEAFYQEGQSGGKDEE